MRAHFWYLLALRALDRGIYYADVMSAATLIPLMFMCIVMVFVKVAEDRR
jgi:hypothetical protein